MIGVRVTEAHPPSTNGGTPPGIHLPPLEPTLPALVELAIRPQWVGWKHVQRRGRWTKEPYQIDDTLASSTDPTTWTDYDAVWEAVSTGRRGFNGAGFVFTADDPYVMVDLDDCIDPVTEEIAPWAAAAIDQLDTYAEVSPSGRGVRLIARGHIPDTGRKRGPCEMYAAKRFATITGNHLPGRPTTINERGPELRELFATWFGEPNGDISAGEQAPPFEPNQVDLTDEELLAKIRASKNRERFDALWAGDLSDYEGDASRADWALIDELIWWTGGDVARTDGLFRQSGLMREKWDDRRGSTTYGRQSILKRLQGKKKESLYSYIRVRIASRAIPAGDVDRESAPAPRSPRSRPPSGSGCTSRTSATSTRPSARSRRTGWPAIPSG